jgi:hypothetical protein
LKPLGKLESYADTLVYQPRLMHTSSTVSPPPRAAAMMATMALAAVILIYSNKQRSMTTIQIQRKTAILMKLTSLG